MKNLTITTTTVGTFSIEWWKKKQKYISLHFLPFKDIQWGYKEDWYDGPHYSFGFGPLLLICWSK